MSNLADLTPGVYVRHADHPEWGIGQIQSAVGLRVTVNFEHMGKQLINAGVVNLVVLRPEEMDDGNLG
jgi:hypothetical protein